LEGRKQGKKAGGEGESQLLKMERYHIKDKISSFSFKNQSV
jgi:hypothetical protein